MHNTAPCMWLALYTNDVMMWYTLWQCNLHGHLTFKTKSIELAGDVSDEASGASTEAKLSNEVTDHAVQGFIVSFHSLRPQHVLPQEASHGLPFLSFTSNTNTQGKCKPKLKLV